jgi:16S rRNA (guanine527-N7)-methyltransferase
MQLLAQSAKEKLNLTISEPQLNSFQRYYELLVEWNSRFNLTAVTDLEGVQIRHFLDSLTLAAPALNGNMPLDFNTASLIDIGAGAGFPGLPLKILFPGLRLTLSESVGKKALFLETVAKELHLENVTVLTKRAEELGQDSKFRQKFDMATGRAVAHLAVLAEYCLPLCKVNGYFIAPKKGDKLAQEISEGQTALKKLGGKLLVTPDFALPGSAQADRRLVVVQKIAPTPSGYPRRVGLPSQKPIL